MFRKRETEQNSWKYPWGGSPLYYTCKSCEKTFFFQQNLHLSLFTSSTVFTAHSEASAQARYSGAIKCVQLKNSGQSKKVKNLKIFGAEESFLDILPPNSSIVAENDPAIRSNWNMATSFIRIL